LPDTRPLQTEIPDDLVPNRTGYSREQLAIRTLAEIVSDLIFDAGGSGLAEQRRRDEHQMRLREVLAEVFTLTEPT
jgi:hypothetical protein